MPELPEVQATVDYLESRIAGLKILNACFTWPNSLVTHSKQALQALLSGRKVKSVYRRAKYIVLVLEANKLESYLIIHLRMSGSLEVLKTSLARDPYDRFWLEFNNSKELRFNDVRKFGKVYYYTDLEDFNAGLGIEPLSEKFTAEYLGSKLANRKTRIKPFLLDQSEIAGIGNIYADESLWRAGINPAARTDLISKNKTKLLQQSIKQVLIEAIDLKGTDNGDEVVSGGLYSPGVYGREGKKCLRCKQNIKKIFLAQRGTHYCPKCQRL